MRRRRLLGAALAVPLCGATCPAAAAEDLLCGRAVTSFEQIAAELARDSALKPIPNGGADFVAYGQEEPLRQWYVTKPHYPGLKAVVCRFLQEEGGRFFVKVETRCFGPKPDCDRLAAAFGKS